MPRIEIILYGDDGSEVGRMSGTITEADAVYNQVTKTVMPADPIAALAKRSGVYTRPAKHMTASVLRIHDDASSYAASRHDCPEMTHMGAALRNLWWLWYDMPEMDQKRLAVQFTHLAAESRLKYAEWLSSSFEGHGAKGRDARYTVRRYLSAFRRGQMKTSTFDGKMDAARERLEMMRKKIT